MISNQITTPFVFLAPEFSRILLFIFDTQSEKGATTGLSAIDEDDYKDHEFLMIIYVIVLMMMVMYYKH